MKIAQEILNQLGGNKFIAMTGAKNLAYGDNFLTFKIGKNEKKVTNVKITLNDLDLYDIEFLNVRGFNVKTVSETNGVYADQIQNVFTKSTELDTNL